MNAWMDDIQRRLSRHNQILFTRESPCLQELLAQIRRQKHRTLVLWAFRCVERPLAILRAHHPEEERPQQAVALCRLWAAGEVKMPVAKRALLQAHQVAKELSSPEDTALCHAVGQACATVHVETHAVGLPVYELQPSCGNTGWKPANGRWKTGLPLTSNACAPARGTWMPMAAVGPLFCSTTAVRTRNSCWRKSRNTVSCHDQIPGRAPTVRPEDGCRLQPLHFLLPHCLRPHTFPQNDSSQNPLSSRRTFPY